MGEGTKPSPTYFYDASAIVKLVVDEPGAQKSRKIFEPAGQVYTSWVVIAEALGVLKRKWLKSEISDIHYSKAVHLLLAYVAEARLKAVDLRLHLGRPALETYETQILEIRRKHPQIDAGDALQFAAIQTSFLSGFAAESKTQLVSADGDLLAVAVDEGIPILDVSS